MAEKIEVRINEALGFTPGTTSTWYTPTDAGGPNERQLVAEAGPGFPGAISGTCGPILTTSLWTQKPQLQTEQSVTIRTGADLSAEWATIQQVISETNRANLDYTIRGGLGGVDGLYQWQNSNSFVSTALYAIGERQAPKFQRPNGSFYSPPGSQAHATNSDCTSEGKLPNRTVLFNWLGASDEHNANGQLVRKTAVYEGRRKDCKFLLKRTGWCDHKGR